MEQDFMDHWGGDERWMSKDELEERRKIAEEAKAKRKAEDKALLIDVHFNYSNNFEDFKENLFF